MFLSRLKAGALQLTLFVAVVIALILTGFILLVHTHKQFNIKTNFIIETSQNTNRGINQVLINSSALNDTVSIDLKEEYKSLKVHRQYWGVFEKVIAVAKTKDNTLKRVALIGANQPKNNRTALYVQDNNKPLVVVGNTKIEGVAYLSSLGIKSGIISQQSYSGSQLIYGEIRRASTLLKIDNEIVSQLKSIDKENVNPFLNLENGKTFSNSFLKPKQIVFSNSEITLSNINVIGNIIIQSKTKIVVEASALLKDVILIAPEIIIEDSVKGNFQAIASKNINVGKNVLLDYPSALVLNEREIQQESNISGTSVSNKILINDGSTVKGIVVFLSEEKTNNYNPQIELTEKATVIGEVYCTENVELKGNVYGSIFTNNFIAKQSGSIYQNHIYNGTIIVNQLPKEYVGLSFNDSKKGVLKWLY